VTSYSLVHWTTARWSNKLRLVIRVLLFSLSLLALDQFGIVRGGTSNLNVNVGEMFLAGAVGVVREINIARVVNQINKLCRVTIRVYCSRLPTRNVYNTDSMLLDKVK
jgi:hypothetical protein